VNNVLAFRLEHLLEKILELGNLAKLRQGRVSGVGLLAFRDGFPNRLKIRRQILLAEGLQPGVHKGLDERNPLVYELEVEPCCVDPLDLLEVAVTPSVIQGGKGFVVVLEGLSDVPVAERFPGLLCGFPRLSGRRFGLFRLGGFLRRAVQFLLKVER